MDYIIQYSALNVFGNVLKQGKMKVKNKLSELHAKSSLDDYFKRKYQDFDKLIVYKCVEDTILSKIQGGDFEGFMEDLLK